MPFMAWANSVDPDHSAHPCHPIRICTVHFLVRNNLINQKANSVDPDQMAQMFHLIWIYIVTVCPCHIGVYVEERVKVPWLNKFLLLGKDHYISWLLKFAPVSSPYSQHPECGLHCIDSVLFILIISTRYVNIFYWLYRF
jgi:hypothetical protein